MHAEDIYRQAGGAGPQLAADLHFERGMLSAAEGKLDSADTELRQCLADRRARLGEHSLSVAKTQLALAQVLLKEGRISEAKQAAQATLPMVPSTFPPAEGLRRQASEILNQASSEN